MATRKTLKPRNVTFADLESIAKTGKRPINKVKIKPRKKKK